MSVVSLFAERMRRLKLNPPEPEYLYFCMKCSGQSFRISAGGDVFCANPVCKVKMSNLHVEGKPV